MTTFKISNDCHIKTCWSLKRRAILKIPRAIFLEEPIGYVGFKMKPLRKSFFQCGDKNQPKFCRKTSVYLMSHVSNICTLWYVIMEFEELNWICKHEKGQKQPSSHSFTELSKNTFVPVSIIKKTHESFLIKKLNWTLNKCNIVHCDRFRH